jgi:hypothetical protein
VESHIVASHLSHLEAQIAPLRRQLAAHPLYSAIHSPDDLRIFMESHVFAVWDFMSLLKALQNRLTCVEVPWAPTPYPASRRFINEIVLGEESDLYEGRSISHFELYLEAMEESGADTRPMREVLKQLHTAPELEPEDVMSAAQAPPSAIAFVASTFALIREHKVHRIAAAFTFGREDIIPEIFRGLVRDFNTTLHGELTKFAWYLERHIELDAEDHGPLALRMIADLCGNNDTLWAEAGVAAESSLRARLSLWDGITSALQKQKKNSAFQV